nr:hypothetical protein [Nostoc sp. EkiNYC01]
MYKEERTSITHPDGRVEIIIKIERNESGVLELCGAIACITFFSLVVWLIVANHDNNRRLDSELPQPNQAVRSDSW